MGLPRPMESGPCHSAMASRHPPALHLGSPEPRVLDGTSESSWPHIWMMVGHWHKNCLKHWLHAEKSHISHIFVYYRCYRYYRYYRHIICHIYYIIIYIVYIYIFIIYIYHITVHIYIYISYIHTTYIYISYNHIYAILTVGRQEPPWSPCLPFPACCQASRLQEHQPASCLTGISSTWQIFKAETGDNKAQSATKHKQ